MIEVLKQAAEDVSKAYDILAFAHTERALELLAKTRTSLRQAIAQLALDGKVENARELGLDYYEQEPVVWMDADGNVRMTTNAFQFLFTPPPPPPQRTEPVCPECKAGVLYECVACSSNNYPPQRTEPKVCCQQYNTCLEPCTPRGMYLAQRTEERNFCPRCGKRLGGEDSIHTCTPPQEQRSCDKRTWVGLTMDEIALLHANYPNPQGFALALQAKLKEKNSA